MNASIQAKLTQFAENTQAIKKDFVWQNYMTRRLAALLYAIDGKPVDVEAIRSCHDMIKSETNIFSWFRGHMAICIAAMLSLRPNSQEAFANTKAAYELLKDAKFWKSDYLAVAAYQIAANAPADQYDAVISRARSFYEEMKKQHFFLTSRNDYIFSVMLGLSDVDVAQGSRRIEEIYQHLKPSFFTANSVQTLAQILALSSAGSQTVERVLELKNAFRDQKLKLDKMYTAPALGILALLPVAAETLVSDIAEAKTFLRGQKGFGSLSIDTQQLLLCASCVVATVYAKELSDKLVTATLTTSVTNLIIAQEAAMIAAISASTVVTTSTSS